MRRISIHLLFFSVAFVYIYQSVLWLPSSRASISENIPVRPGNGASHSEFTPKRCDFESRLSATRIAFAVHFAIYDRLQFVRNEFFVCAANGHTISSGDAGSRWKCNLWFSAAIGYGRPTMAGQESRTHDDVSKWNRRRGHLHIESIPNCAEWECWACKSRHCIHMERRTWTAQQNEWQSEWNIFGWKWKRNKKLKNDLI